MGRTVALGLGAAALYAAVFLNADLVMKYFTRGGWYAALPVATVFVFSFVHGAFASNLWSLLGIEATKKVQPRVSTDRPAPRKRPRPAVTADADTAAPSCAISPWTIRKLIFVKSSLANIRRRNGNA